MSITSISEIRRITASSQTNKINTIIRELMDDITMHAYRGNSMYQRKIPEGWSAVYEIIANNFRDHGYIVKIDEFSIKIIWL